MESAVQVRRAIKLQELYIIIIIIVIALNFSDPFIKSLIFHTQSSYPEIQMIVKKYEKQTEDIKSKSFYQKLLGDVLDKIPIKDLDNMIDYHKVMSISTGANVGLVTENVKPFTIIRLFNKLFEYLHVRKVFF